MSLPRRALVAAGLLAVLVAGLLGAWFVAGWTGVRDHQRAVRDAPRLDAERRAGELAHQLRGELAQLIGREVDRPYFHYQNLFHDPRASAASVAPSPLAQGARDPLVLGYFQLDAAGRMSTPTINDELPDLSDAAHLADNRRFRDEAVRSLAGELGRHTGALVASAGAPQPQVITIDPSTYSQNNASNSVYVEQRRAPLQVQAPAMAQPQTPSIAQAQRAPPMGRGDARAAGAGGVAITVSPLAWRTLPFAGQPSLVAVRQVDTPDGRLSQGFVIDRTALTSWLASHAGDAVAELRTGDGGAADIAPGWHLEVAPNPRAVIAAGGDADAIARGFVLRFAGAGAIAVLAALLVVMLVVRAERLARERSQFAAAAAHELRTPLAGLQLYGDMLADGLGDPGKLRDYARRMSEEAARLGRVVSNVLGFSQLQRGNLSVDPRVAPLDAALHELAERARPALERAGAPLALDVAPDLSARFDRDAVARIVGNLLDNAEKYSRGAGDRTITLAAHDTGGVVEIAVSDHGPGVTAKARSRLFRPFARGAPADGPAGLGLGLALSQSLARAMAGELAYRPAAGGGARFVLSLPRA